jgi:hypothetical protein
MRNEIKRVVEIDGEYIRITLYRDLGTDFAQSCRYQIKMEGEGLVIDQIVKRGDVEDLLSVDAVEYEWEDYTCPACEDSEVVGRHYKHNDPDTGQFVNCDKCNKDGDLGPDGDEDYDPTEVHDDGDVM